MIFKKLAQKLNTKRNKYVAGMVNPIDVDFALEKNTFLDNLTKKAVEMYEKKCDIKNFTRLALSCPENNSHEEIMAELFKQGVVDPFEDEKLNRLAQNEKLLRDLGLSD